MTFQYYPEFRPVNVLQRQNVNRILLGTFVSPTMSEHFTVIQEKEGEFFGPRQALIHGVRLTFYAPNIDKDFERDLSRFETRPEDIYVVSFPKSGKAID